MRALSFCPLGHHIWTSLPLGEHFLTLSPLGERL